LAAVAFEVSISLFYNGTYLATLVPTFTDGLKYAVVAGAVAGGGLTVIANAPNPAAQSILSCYFKDGVALLKLLAAALIPTAIMRWVFLCLGPVGQ
jgi:Na+/H+ antiporter NhaD/arsenite permease-like protein